MRQGGSRSDDSNPFDFTLETIGTSSPVPAEFRSRTGPLLPVTRTTIEDELGPWITARVHAGLGLVPGPLEPWASADLAGWLQLTMGSAPTRCWDIEREVAVYADPDLRVALCCNRRSALPTHPVLVIGVRAQSQRSSPARFRQGVEAELARLETEVRQAEFADAEACLLVVTFDPGGAEALGGLGLVEVTAGRQGIVGWWGVARRPIVRASHR